LENGALAGKGWFEIDGKLVNLSVDAECQQGKAPENIRITDTYFLTGNDKETTGNDKKFFDICLSILEKPVKCNGEIVPGVRRDELNPSKIESLGAKPPYHIH
jgi:hypothetical protein